MILRAAIVVVVLFASTCSSKDEAAPKLSWTRAASLPTPRSEIGVASLGNTLYVAGGFTSDGKASRVVESYDSRTNRWSEVVSLPMALHHVGLASAASRVYVVGGYEADGTGSRAVLSWAPGDDRWRREPDMPTGRGALAVAAVEGAGPLIHAVGGATRFGAGGKLTAAHEVYDPTARRWSKEADLPDPRDHLSAAILGSTLYLAGGRKLSLTTNSARLDVYDLETDRWSRGPDMPTARGGLAAAAAAARLVVVGGEQPSGTFPEVEIYDESTSRWLTGPPLPTPRHGLGAAAIGGSVYVVGGGPTPGLSVSEANEVLRAA